MSQANGQGSLTPSVSEIAQAIFTVNRHAKAAPDPKQLYTLKKIALDQLILEGKAKKKDFTFRQTLVKVNKNQMYLYQLETTFPYASKERRLQRVITPRPFKPSVSKSQNDYVIILCEALII